MRSILRKLTIAGNIYELKEFEMPVILGKKHRRKGRANSAFTSAETKIENQKKKASRARRNVRMTANSNPDLDKFLTLTYKDNVTDIDRARKDFDRFLKRLKHYLCKDLKYIVVIEFQKRGAIHFHLLCNLPFVNVDELAQIWGFGFVRINRIDNVDNVGAYITKYMTKENIDERLAGKKCYSMSRNLKKPVVVTDYITRSGYSEIDNILQGIAPVRTHTCEYETEYFGKVVCTQYVCARPRLVPRTGSEKVANFAVERRQRKIGRQRFSPAPARF